MCGLNERTDGVVAQVKSISIRHGILRRVFLTANHNKHSDESDACRVIRAGLMAERRRPDGFNGQGNGFVGTQKAVIGWIAER
jgi:hypothetical protein